MTYEEIPRQEPENPNIPPKVATVIQDSKPTDKRPGREWLRVVYMIVGLFILIAAFQLYFIIQDLIRTWISDQFVPLISAIYYIVVIVVGIWLLRDYIKNQ